MTRALATAAPRARSASGLSGAVRTEITVAVIRATTAVISLALLAGKAEHGGALLAPALWHVALLSSALVPPLVAIRLGSRRSLQVLAVAVTAVDLAYFAGFDIVFHSSAGPSLVVAILVTLEAPIRFGWWGIAATGLPLAVAVSLWPEHDVSGQQLNSVGMVALLAVLGAAAATVRSLTRRPDAAARLVQEQFEVCFQHAATGIALIAGGGRLLQANPAMHRMIGPVPAGAAFPECMAAESREPLWQAFHQSVGRQAPGARLEVRLPDHGSERWALCVLTPLRTAGPGRGGQQARVLLQLEDVTERRAAERQLSDLASRDALTGLGNRLLLLQMIDRSLRGPNAHRCCVLYVDLDRFKQVNDVHGHAAGDELLVAVAGRLSRVVRAGDLVTRTGGDEFVVLCRQVNGPEDAVAVADRIAATLRHPVHLSAGDVPVAASVGIALRGSPEDTAESLIADADTAMYRAKQSGGGHHALFDPAMRIVVRQHLEVEAQLRRDLLSNALDLHYQPTVDLRTGDFNGVEALLRWRGTEGSGLDIGQVIEIAQETELIVMIGDWVMSRLLRERSSASAAGPRDRPLRLSVNVSTRQLLHPGFIGYVIDLLEETGTDPSQLCIEFTETSLAENADAIIGPLRQLHDRGVQLAIDDFGTGYASLTYLSRLSVDVVKVDRSFVAGLGHDATSGVIVRSVIAMAHALGMEVVAEGVETPGQLAILLEAGCDTAQGYLFAHPLPRDLCAEVTARVVPWPADLAGRRSRTDDIQPELWLPRQLALPEPVALPTRR